MYVLFIVVSFRKALDYIVNIACFLLDSKPDFYIWLASTTVNHCVKLYYVNRYMHFPLSFCPRIKRFHKCTHEVLVKLMSSVPKTTHHQSRSDFNLIKYFHDRNVNCFKFNLNLLNRNSRGSFKTMLIVFVVDV